MFVLLKLQSVERGNRTLYSDRCQSTGECEVLRDVLSLSDLQETLRPLRSLWGVRLEATNGLVAHGTDTTDL